MPRALIVGSIAETSTSLITPVATAATASTAIAARDVQRAEPGWSACTVSGDWNEWTR